MIAQTIDLWLRTKGELQAELAAETADFDSGRISIDELEAFHRKVADMATADRCLRMLSGLDD